MQVVLRVGDLNAKTVVRLDTIGLTAHSSILEVLAESRPRRDAVDDLGRIYDYAAKAATLSMCTLALAQEAERTACRLIHTRRGGLRCGTRGDSSLLVNGTIGAMVTCSRVRRVPVLTVLASPAV